MDPSDRFLFTVCQIGAEAALKSEIARGWPELRFSYSRPGFVTFKLPADAVIPEDFDLQSTFARTYGFSQGRVAGENATTMANDVWQRTVGAFAHLHVWQRDARLPGERGFEPGITPLAQEIGQQIAAARPESQGGKPTLVVNRRARSGDRVLDCVLVEPHEWWIGIHQARSMPSRCPGGVCVAHEPGEVISRAFWKMREALAWSQLPVEPGDRCAEIGSAPGGSSQALLATDLSVIGIDPAEMDERVLAHPNFEHVRKRAADMKRREFCGIRWLTADSNVAPKHTLDTVEAIVTHDDVHIRGLLLTLKLPAWHLADEIPTFLDRIRSWGYGYVRARQLAWNRHEFCVAALRSRAMRRRPGKK